MEVLKGLHFVVSGRVQGVFFRASTKEEARTIGVRGWVRNLGDGQVEACAYGNEEQLRKFEEWLERGPPAAAVQCVETKETPYVEMETFEIR